MKNKNPKYYIDKIGNFSIEFFHYLGLFVIAAVIFYLAFEEIYSLFRSKDINISTVFMLFIYLELGAMVGIYFKTYHLPVRFFLYISITALTRHLISIITEHFNDDKKIIYYCVGILILSLSILVIRYASYKYPSISDSKKGIEQETS